MININFEKPKITTFEELDDGDMFLYKDILYIKTDMEVNNYNATDITTGGWVGFNKTTHVHCVDVDITIRKQVE